MLRASLVISLQNNLHFTELMLVSIEQQSVRDFELLLIADLASTDLIRTVQTRLPLLHLPARVVWSNESATGSTPEQLMMSTALRCVQSEYVIFSDGACVLHNNFVEEHINNAAPHGILSGRRVELSGQISSALDTQQVRAAWLEKNYHYVLFDGVFGQSMHVTRGLYLQSKLLRSLLSNRSHDIFPGNFSLFREDAKALLDYIETSKEIHVQTMITQLGLHIHLLRNVLIQYHLNHNDESPLRIVPGVLERVKRLRYSVSEFGLQPAMFEAHRARQGR